MKRQNNMTLKDELPRSVGAQYATGVLPPVIPLPGLVGDLHRLAFLIQYRVAVGVELRGRLTAYFPLAFAVRRRGTVPAHQPERLRLIVVSQHAVGFCTRVEKRNYLTKFIALIFEGHADLRLRIAERRPDDPLALIRIEEHLLVVLPIVSNPER